MILFIDSSVREASRTRRLAEHLLAALGGEYERVSLAGDTLPALGAEMLERRSSACERGDFSDAYFDTAKQFAAADEIVICAPFWDLSFPASLKKYIETVCIPGLTFRYAENGMPSGLCRARRLFFVTTAGGTIFNDAYGFGYISDLARLMFGIPDVRMIKAEGLDVDGADVEGILAAAFDAADAAARGVFHG